MCSAYHSMNGYELAWCLKNLLLDLKRSWLLRAPEFGSQHPHGISRSSVNPKVPNAHCWPSQALGMHTVHIPTLWAKHLRHIKNLLLYLTILGKFILLTHITGEPLNCNFKLINFVTTQHSGSPYDTLIHASHLILAPFFISTLWYPSSSSLLLWLVHSLL